MQDYQGNSNKKKTEQQKAPQTPKKIEKVIETEVVVKKRSLGRTFKDIFMEADVRGVASHVVTDVLIPAARNMIVDATQKGIERLVYGDRAVRRRDYGSGTRITYESPISRSRPSDISYRRAPAVSPAPRNSRRGPDDIILTSKAEAELVLERMNDIVDQYGVASIGDLNELVGIRSSHVDEKWGWAILGNVPIRQIREGYLIDFPPVDPIE